MSTSNKKHHIIYKTTNIITGNYYLGMHSTDDLNDGYVGSGRRLLYSIKKYGVQQHIVEILEHLPSREELKRRESEIITLNEIQKQECLNMTIGGEGGPTRQGCKHTEETKKKISASLIGHSLSLDTRKKISIGNKGKHVVIGKEQRIKISMALKGRPSKLKGVSRTDETKRRISEKLKARPFSKRKPLSEATKRKLSLSNKGKHGDIAVVQLDMQGNEIKAWNSIREAEIHTKAYHIGKVCKEKRKSSGGYKWKLADINES